MTAQGKRASADRQITVGDRTYTLRFSLRAMMALQDHYGLKTLGEVGARLADASQFAAEDLVAVVWAGLRTHHAELSQEDALEILDEIGLAEMQSMIGESFEAAAADDDGGGADDARPPKPGRSTV